MLNINAFRLVVHEKKIYQNFPYFAPYLGPKRGQPLYLNKSESPSAKHVSCQVWLKLTIMVLEKKSFKGKG